MPDPTSAFPKRPDRPHEACGKPPAAAELEELENSPQRQSTTAEAARSNLAAALTYARAGVSVLPLRGKVPVTALARRGSKSATRNPDTIETWWMGKNYNIGGVVPPGMIVLDVDPRNGGERTLSELERTFGPMPKTRACGTGGGGMHLWFRYDGSRPGRLAGIDIKMPGSYVVMPPSVHPETGEPYEWLNDGPMAPLPHWLHALVDTASKPTDRAPARVVGDRSKLPPAAWDMLRHGTKSSGDTTRSGVFWSCLWYLIHAGWTSEQVMDLARDPNYPGLHAYLQKRGPREVASQYERVVELSGQRGTARTLNKLGRIEFAIELATDRGYWTGKDGSNTLVILELFLALAKKVAKTSVRYTHPQLMEAGGFYRRQTVMAAVARLVEKGWLKVKAPPSGRKGVLYEIGVPKALDEEVGHLLEVGVPLRSEMRNRLPVGHDAFVTRNRTPGKEAYVILRCLPWPLFPSSPNDEETAEELEKKGSLSKQRLESLTGLSPSTVHRHLTDLTERGILQKVGRGSWRRRPGVGPDEMAEVFGTVGAGEEIAQMVAALRAGQTERLQTRPKRGRAI